MPISEGFRYCLTCVDRFSRWPEAIPMEDQEATTVARTFFSTWIARFGVPLKVTTDQGRQFESHLFKQLNILTGTAHFRTSAYHPQANGLVERLHRQLKGAIMCHAVPRWTEILPAVMLGIRTAWKDDLKSSAAEMVYGEPIRIPGEFFAPTNPVCNDAPINYVQTLRQYIQQLRPTDGSNHGRRSIFIFKELSDTESVFLRRGGPKGLLQQPYEGPFKVVERSDKTFTNHPQTAILSSNHQPVVHVLEDVSDSRIVYKFRDLNHWQGGIVAAHTCPLIFDEKMQAIIKELKGGIADKDVRTAFKRAMTVTVTRSFHVVSKTIWNPLVRAGPI
ncbi:uncharacterized protein K02A2.6-like [Agrilus planipennis]|uniref:Uncharacterized protein K02A2.6-like n=1 Tax=Agrilus planipennis TaxID=224129 RepID=A0A1W4WUA2_AGRPL|nr:uncharacterized protein K02A2.6-like [Agrilus planipennis]